MNCDSAQSVRDCGLEPTSLDKISCRINGDSSVAAVIFQLSALIPGMLSSLVELEMEALTHTQGEGNNKEFEVYCATWKGLAVVIAVIPNKKLGIVDAILGSKTLVASRGAAITAVDSAGVHEFPLKSDRCFVVRPAKGAVSKKSAVGAIGAEIAELHLELERFRMLRCSPN